MIDWMRCWHVGFFLFFPFFLSVFTHNIRAFIVPTHPPTHPCTNQLLQSTISTAGTDHVDLLLLMASKEGDTPKVEELLEAGADPSIKDKDGKTPLDLAEKEEVIEMLEAALAKVKV